MKGDAAVIVGLQEAINLEATLSNQYFMYAKDTRRFGLALAKKFKCLHEQCEQFTCDLIKKMLFLEGNPELAPGAVKSTDSVAEMIVSSLDAERALIERYVVLCKETYDADDLSNFHYYQHLSKWHTTGGNGYKGHISWLQKQQWQIEKLGEQGYLAAQVIK